MKNLELKTFLRIHFFNIFLSGFLTLFFSTGVYAEYGDAQLDQNEYFFEIKNHISPEDRSLLAPFFPVHFDYDEFLEDVRALTDGTEPGEDLRILRDQVTQVLNFRLDLNKAHQVILNFKLANDKNLALQTPNFYEFIPGQYQPLIHFLGEIEGFIDDDDRLTLANITGWLRFMGEDYRRSFEGHMENSLWKTDSVTEDLRMAIENYKARYNEQIILNTTMLLHREYFSLKRTMLMPNFPKDIHREYARRLALKPALLNAPYVFQSSIHPMIKNIPIAALKVLSARRIHNSKILATLQVIQKSNFPLRKYR